MKLVSVNVGLPRDVMWRRQNVSTGIFKAPVSGRVAVRTLNLDGDGQADLTVHGGRFKAIYCYPGEHYAWWRGELDGRELEPAMFGENFTTDGLDEASVHIGDRFSIGSAQVIVTQPRLPCYKLGIRFNAPAFVRQFLASGRTGFYLAVEREGDCGAGDPITLLSADAEAVAVAAITRLYVAETYGSDDRALIRRAMRVAAFPDSWKDHFRERLT
jgi:MOSC domain-containing protein YiiM